MELGVNGAGDANLADAVHMARTRGDRGTAEETPLPIYRVQVRHHHRLAPEALELSQGRVCLFVSRY